MKVKDFFIHLGIAALALMLIFLICDVFAQFLGFNLRSYILRPGYTLLPSLFPKAAPASSTTNSSASVTTGN